MSSVLIGPVFAAVVTVLAPIGLAFFFLAFFESVKAFGVELTRGRFNRWVSLAVGIAVILASALLLTWLVRKTLPSLDASTLRATEELPRWSKLQPFKVQNELHNETLAGVANGALQSTDGISSLDVRIAARLAFGGLTKRIQEAAHKIAPQGPYVYVYYSFLPDPGSALWNQYAPSRIHLVDGLDAIAMAANVGNDNGLQLAFIGSNAYHDVESLSPSKDQKTLVLVWPLAPEAKTVLDDNKDGVFVTDAIQSKKEYK